MGVRPNGLEDTPQYKIDIDQEKAQALGVSISDINTTLGAAWGGSYVNDFIDRGRVKKVYVMGQAAIAYAAGRHQQLVRAQQRRDDGAVLRLLHRRTGNTVHRVWSVTTVCRRWKSWVRPRRAKAPVKP